MPKFTVETCFATIVCPDIDATMAAVRKSLESDPESTPTVYPYCPGDVTAFATDPDEVDEVEVEELTMAEEAERDALAAMAGEDPEEE